jgi:trehalose 6-phosphate synthase/phosphatase
VQVKDSILRALEMPQEEKSSRFKRNLEFANRLNTVKWAETILIDLKKVEKSPDMTLSSTLGLGIDFRVTGVTAGFRPLDLVQVSKDFKASQQRLILLDWGGTLVESLDNYEAYAVATGHVSRGGVSNELVDILQPLGSDSRNHIFIISGKDIYSMQEYFKPIENIGLAAEHGCYYRFPKNSVLNGDKQRWNTMISLDDTGWMDAVRRVMDVYTQRTHGTYIEQKGSAIIWQFRDADRDFGVMQSKELEEHLHEIVNTHQSPLEVIRGGGIDDGYIEVRPEGLSKGLFLEHILSVLKSNGILIDFMMGFGDDISDEDMFKAIRRIESKSQVKNAETKKMCCYGVAVGKKHSAAHAFVDDPDAVIEVLQAMKKHTLNERRYKSALDLSAHEKVVLGGLSGLGGTAARRTSTAAIQITRSTSESLFSTSVVCIINHDIYPYSSSRLSAV